MVKIGDKIKLTEDALDNYGQEYAGKTFRVTSVAKNKRQHQGYDEGVVGNLIDVDGLEFSLYDYEFEIVRSR